MFHFRPSETGAPGHTTFVHEETFTGLLGGVMGDNWISSAAGLRSETQKGFESFNKDLKEACEE